MSSGEPLTSPKAPPSPSSPSLEPPRKSVELEDAGTRDMESSAEEEDVFSDAREALASPKAPAAPLTRVEKVDDSPSHGEVPGTEAYKKRAGDAVPDEVEVVPDGEPSAPSSRRGSAVPVSGGNTVTIPRTVVEKVDDSPSHGDVPGTVAHEMRKADYVPDSIVKSGTSTPSGGHRSSPSLEGIPKTVVTRVDSEPSHGEVPGTEAFKKRMQDAKPDLLEKDEEHQTFFSPMNSGFGRDAKSPIAADGGFGPMEYDGSEESDNDDPPQSPEPMYKPSPQSESSAGPEEEDAGDDFDDFEEGAEGEDFGDFDDGDDVPEPPEPPAVKAPPVPITVPSFDIPDFSDTELDAIIASTKSHLDELFPKTIDDLPENLPSMPESSSLFLSSRSHSLWSQLVAPPPLQPPNWVRSRIRRLFLVSLGVPVDLDEILPASKQKKLVLQYTSSDRAGDPTTSRLKADGDAASDSGTGSKTKSKRRKGPPPAPEFDIPAAKALCTTTAEALDGMSDTELRAHVQKLDELVLKGREVMQYWVSRKDAAVSEKEAFDGVIENLVQHARRTRK